jgi:hypothetical protein
MSSNDTKANQDIGSIFFKKGKGKSGAQKKTGPQTSQPNPLKEEKKLNAKEQNDYESDDDETHNACLDIGTG